MIAGFLRGAADFWDAVQAARAEQRTGFSEREAGDYLDTAGLDDACTCSTSQCALEVEDMCDEAESSDPDGFVGLAHPGGWCLPAGAAPPQPVNLLDELFTDDVVDAEVHCEGCKCPTICGCGREIYAEYDRPGSPPLWFHRDDDSPITLDCARIRDAKSSPGEVSGEPPAPPSPGDPNRPADFDAVTAAFGAVMEWVDRPDNNAALIGCTPSMVAGVAVNAYRAALKPVSHEDLAAHITAIRKAWFTRTGGVSVDLNDEIASDLLADYRITKK